MGSAYMDYTDWKEQERAADERNAKELGQLMLWALAEGVPAKIRDKLDHYEISYERIEAVIYVPNRHTPSVQLRDGQAEDSVTTSSAREVMLLSCPPGKLPDIRALVDISDERKKELFDAMRNAYTVEYGGEEYCRIQAILFRRDPESGRIFVTLELVDKIDRSVTEVPQQGAKPTGHLLNRGGCL